MKDFHKEFVIPNKEDWVDVYNGIMGILCAPTEDMKKISAVSRGGVTEHGTWIIMENISDGTAPYIYVSAFDGKFGVDACNITDEKFERISALCADFPET